MEMVRLKNGKEEPKSLVATVTVPLRLLAEGGLGGAMALYELHQKAKDPNHQFSGNTGEKLQRLGLVGSDGNLPESVRNVVLSAIEGDGLGMTLGSPVSMAATHQDQKGSIEGKRR